MAEAQAAKGEFGSAEGARRAMQRQLTRTFFWTVAAASLALIAREIVFGGPRVTATVAFLVSSVVLAWSYRPTAPLRALALALFLTMVLLITGAARALGGASGPALCFGFVPGYLAMLVLGPVGGWGVCAAMLAAFAWLLATSGFAAPLDRLRFIDDVAMTIFAAGLAHALVRSFSLYERAIDARGAVLRQRRADRQLLIQAVYERLEPLASRLTEILDRSGATERDVLQRLLRQLSDALKQVKTLCGPDTAETERAGETDRSIRSSTMRVWLRLAALLMAFFVVRNLITQSPFVPSLFSLAFCLLVDLWLARPASSKYMELTALAVGLLATGPMIVHIHEFGGTPDAPPLVIAPSIVLFTALLSQGPAAFALIAVNVGILIWVGRSGSLSLKQLRLLGDLALIFVVVVLAETRVFALRRRYAQALVEQRRSLAEAARQQRRLAGTLFHDVSNHVQMLSFYVEFEDLSAELRHARSLGHRVRRLITLSKEFLLPGNGIDTPRIEAVRLADAVESVQEAFGPRIEAKGLKFQAGPDLDLRVRAQVELLIESVLGNLVSNAIKFSNPDAAISLTCERVGGEVRIVVADAGPGLPPDVLRHLGEDGALPSQTGTAGESGQGFGLHLAFDHLQRMGGRLELRNRQGGGAEATVWLPAA